MDVYAGYYGALTTVSWTIVPVWTTKLKFPQSPQLVWSPDGRYVLVSGFGPKPQSAQYADVPHIDRWSRRPHYDLLAHRRPDRRPLSGSHELCHFDHV